MRSAHRTTPRAGGDRASGYDDDLMALADALTTDLTACADGSGGEVADLDLARLARAARARARALASYRHPALRWQAGADTAAAHRRTPAGRAVCGAAGVLQLADSAVPLCGTCYPHRP